MKTKYQINKERIEEECLYELAQDIMIRHYLKGNKEILMPLELADKVAKLNIHGQLKFGGRKINFY